MLGLMQDRPLLISSLIDHAARWHGRSAIVSRLPDGSIYRTNYAELGARSKRLARALLRLGVKRADRVGTLAWNTHRHMELYYAVSGIGAIIHTVNPRLFPEQIDYIINHAEDEYLFADVTFAPLIEGLIPKLKTLKAVVWLCGRDQMPVFKGGPSLCYEDLLAQESDDFEWPQFDERTASGLCYTSGTTGNPKGVLYSHRSSVLHSFLVCAKDGLNLGQQDSALVIVPLFHVNAWGVPHAAAMCGAKLVLPGPMLDGKSVFELLRDESCNLTLGVPTVWIALFQYLDANPHLDLSALRLERVVIGGSAAPRAIIERFRDQLGAFVVHAWGMTETSPLGTVGNLKREHLGLSVEERTRIQMKQGRAQYGVDMKIVDDEGRELPRDGKATGLLKVRGPWITSGYFRAEGPPNIDEEGWFATGDVASLDPDGYMQITDRAKDIIKSGGEWISSIDLENAAVGHPAVAEAAVIGVAHSKWQERPLMILVPKAGARIDKQEMMAFLSERVAKWWLPDDIVTVESLPHTATGKLLKSKLREQFGEYKLPTD